MFDVRCRTLNARGSIWSDVIGVCCQKTLEIFVSIKFCPEGKHLSFYCNFSFDIFLV